MSGTKIIIDASKADVTVTVETEEAPCKNCENLERVDGKAQCGALMLPVSTKVVSKCESLGLFEEKS